MIIRDEKRMMLLAGNMCYNRYHISSLHNNNVPPYTAYIHASIKPVYVKQYTLTLGYKAYIAHVF